MRIYDDKNKQPLKTILIMLTPKETHELIGKLKTLDMVNDHIHVDDENYKREITIGLYSSQNLHNFSDDVIRLLEEDE